MTTSQRFRLWPHRRQCWKERIGQQLAVHDALGGNVGQGHGWLPPALTGPAGVAARDGVAVADGAL